MYILAIILEVLLIALDQLSKYYAKLMLENKGSITVFEGIFDLTFVENRGAAFGIMQGGRWFFIVLTIIMLIWMFVYFIKLPKAKPYGYVRFSLVLISAGAIGNFIDRLRQGYVIDFFHARFIDFPVFNVADIYVVTGTILLAILLLFIIKEDDTKTIK